MCFQRIPVLLSMPSAILQPSGKCKGPDPLARKYIVVRLIEHTIGNWTLARPSKYGTWKIVQTWGCSSKYVFTLVVLALKLQFSGLCDIMCRTVPARSHAEIPPPAASPVSSQSLNPLLTILFIISHLSSIAMRQPTNVSPDISCMSKKSKLGGRFEQTRRCLHA